MKEKKESDSLIFQTCDFPHLLSLVGGVLTRHKDMWFLILVVLASLVGLFCLTFVVELVLAMKHKEGSRPSTWLAFLATTLRQFFFNLGRFLAMLPDVFGWLRRLGLLIRDLFFRWVPRAVAEKAVDDLQRALTACFKTPLGYVEGVWDGLMAVRIPWLSWPLFFGGSVVVLFLLECGAIYYDWPAPLWPTWYAGLIGSAAWLVIQLFLDIGKFLSDIPRGLYQLVVSVKDMVPEKVYRGLLGELTRLADPYIAIRAALLSSTALALLTALFLTTFAAWFVTFYGLLADWKAASALPSAAPAPPAAAPSRRTRHQAAQLVEEEVLA